MEKSHGGEVVESKCRKKFMIYGTDLVHSSDEFSCSDKMRALNSIGYF